MKKRRITIASAKARGMKLQHKACEILSDASGIRWGTDDDAPIAPRPGAQHGVDVILRGEAAKVILLSVECKCCEKWSIDEFIEQARANQKEGTDWLLVLKKNKYKAPMFLMDASLFSKMYKSHIKELKKKRG